MGKPWFQFLYNPTNIGKGASAFSQVQGPIQKYTYIGRGVVPGFVWRYTTPAGGSASFVPQVAQTQGLGGIQAGSFAVAPLINTGNPSPGGDIDNGAGTAILPTSGAFASFNRPESALW